MTDTSYREGSNAKRPTGLVVLSILYILLGSLGVCGGVLNLGSIAMQGAANDMLQHTGATGTSGASFEQLAALQAKYTPLLGASAVVHLVLAIALIAASAMALSLSAPARKVMMGTLAFGVVVALAGSAMEAIVTHQMVAETQRIMGADLGAMGAGSEAVGQMFKFQEMFSGCFPIFWGVVRLGLFIGGLVYFNSKEARAAFGQPTTM